MGPSRAPPRSERLQALRDRAFFSDSTTHSTGHGVMRSGDKPSKLSLKSHPTSLLTKYPNPSTTGFLTLTQNFWSDLVRSAEALEQKESITN